MQINIRGTSAGVILLIAAAAQYLVDEWLSWRLSSVLAEAILSSLYIAPQSIDAPLIRML